MGKFSEFIKCHKDKIKYAGDTFILPKDIEYPDGTFTEPGVFSEEFKEELVGEFS